MFACSDVGWVECGCRLKWLQVVTARSQSMSHPRRRPTAITTWKLADGLGPRRLTSRRATLVGLMCEKQLGRCQRMAWSRPALTCHIRRPRSRGRLQRGAHGTLELVAPACRPRGRPGRLGGPSPDSSARAQPSKPRRCANGFRGGRPLRRARAGPCCRRRDEAGWSCWPKLSGSGLGGGGGWKTSHAASRCWQSCKLTPRARRDARAHAD